MKTGTLVIILALHLAAMPSTAAAGIPGAAGLAAEAKPSRQAPNVLLHLGKIESSDVPKNDVDTAAGLGILWQPQSFSPSLALNFELWGWDWQQPNTAIGGGFLVAADDDVDINVSILSLSLVGVHSFGRRLRGYGQIGLGYSKVDYEVRGSTLFLPGTLAEDDDTGLAPVYGLGIMYADAGLNVGLHARLFDIDTGSQQLGVEDFDAGGQYLGLSVAWQF